MNRKVLRFGAVVLLALALTACGGQDAEDSASAVEDSSNRSFSSAGERGRGETEQAVEEAADSMEDDSQTVADRAEEAGERAAQMIDEAGEQARQTAEEAGEMADQAGERAGEMVDEAAERADRMAADASDAMGESDDSQSAGGESGDPCVVNVEVGDSIAYSVDSISVPSSCESVTINLDHTGSLPKAAMGHNWVLVPADAVQAIGMDGMSAGLESGYLPDDDRIVAATDLIGGGESTSVTFALADLDDSTDYAYVCTFPGHWSAMRGSFSVE